MDGRTNMNAGGSTPTPERLAAYADGELHGSERAAVEAYLEVCPQAAAEVEALRKLACQCRRTAAPEPSPDAWETVLNHLHEKLPPRPLPFPRPARRRPYIPAVGAAAAVLAAVMLGHAFWPGAPVPLDSPATLTGPIELVDARDVEVISIYDGDTGSMLVGEAPLREEIVLAGPGDVTLVGIDAFQGTVPDWRRDGRTPMIVPAIAGEAP
jgi:hypothetical protein